MTAILAVCATCRAAWPWAPASAPPGAILVGPDGTTLRVAPDSHLDPVPPAAQPRGGVAGPEPCNAERLP